MWGSASSVFKLKERLQRNRTIPFFTARHDPAFFVICDISHVSSIKSIKKQNLLLPSFYLSALITAARLVEFRFHSVSSCRMHDLHSYIYRMRSSCIIYLFHRHMMPSGQRARESIKNQIDVDVVSQRFVVFFTLCPV